MDTFLDVEQRPLPTRAGPCAVPVLYRDGSIFAACFRVVLERARPLLDRTCLEPWALGGRALAVVFVCEYRSSTLGAYREVGVALACRRRGARISWARFALDMRALDEAGLWLAALPVTSEVASTAGVELWGQPAYVAPIATRFQDDLRVQLGDELTLSCPALRGPVTRAPPLITLTDRGGRLLRTIIELDCHVRWGLGRGVELAVRGDGPTAATLRALGIQGAAPHVVFRSDALAAKMPAGADTGPLARFEPRAHAAQMNSSGSDSPAA